MRCVLTVLAVVACAALSAGAADDEKYTSKEGKYTVQFPAGAKVKTETKKAGDLDMFVTTVTDGPDKMFAVMYIDLPAGAKDVSSKALLDGAENGALKQSGGKLANSKDFEFGKKKYPARELVVEKDDVKVKTRLILADTRLYVIIIAGKKDFATTKDATKFLDSLELTK